MSGAIRFILDGQARTLEGVDPATTVLQWLRGAERRCGTKEGCAEGDCGACTVVLAELRAGAIRYRAVNACLLLVPALDGRALLTVESLCHRDEPLHPVQSALVACHASQCGFCTPGFVMSLVALYESEPAPSRQRLDEVLAGNLCRCTGYRPIVEAAHLAYRQGGGPRLAVQQAALAAQLRSIERRGTLELEHGGRRFFAPRTLDEAARLAEAHPHARLLAGGTDLGLLVTKEQRDLGTLISLCQVAELAEVTVRDGRLELGAAATYSDALGPLTELAPDLGALVRRVGSLQIRNVATVGGNLANASPIGDMPPALLALDATVVLRQGAAERELPLEELFTGYRTTALRPGELLTRVRIPPRPAGRHFRAYKVAKRFDQDISTVCGAFTVELLEGRVHQVRVCYGGMAATPVRVRSCEEALAGRPWTGATVEGALPALDAALRPLSDLRGSAGYRRSLARNLLRKFQLETAGAEGAPAPGRIAAGAEAP
jgi:xanthine dehydrogenase small subunit